MMWGRFGCGVAVSHRFGAAGAWQNVLKVLWLSQRNEFVFNDGILQERPIFFYFFWLWILRLLLDEKRNKRDVPGFFLFLVR